MSDHSWTAQAKWMREVGATHAAWNSDGKLLSLQLAPEEPPVDETQPSKPSHEKQEQLAREQRRAVASRASGGPIRRLSENTD